MAILLFDIGNTSTKVGLAQKTGVVTTYTLRTDVGQTVDSLGLSLYTLLQHAKQRYGLAEVVASHDGTLSAAADTYIEASVCSSVVPSMTPLVRQACARFVGGDFYTAPGDIEIPLRNLYKNPLEVGADRLVGGYAARLLVPEPKSLVVVDFGTATTFDCISGDAYLGGLIFPGVHTAASALQSTTAKLPRVNLECHDRHPVPGRDTVSSIQHGIVFGYAALVDGLTRRLANQLEGSVQIVGTGGFAMDMGEHATCFSKILPDLVLVGLHRLYYGK